MKICKDKGSEPGFCQSLADQIWLILGVSVAVLTPLCYLGVGLSYYYMEQRKEEKVGDNYGV